MALTIPLAEARRSPGERRIVETRAGNLGVIVRGAGPDVVLIHGVTDNADTWCGVQSRLASKARLHAIDLPGHGLSDVPSRPLLVAEQAAAVIAYMDSAGIADCVVSGNSLGGGVTLGICHQAPERVRAAVTLCAIGTRFPMPWSLAAMRHWPLAEGAALVARSVSLGRLSLRDVYHRGFRPSDQTVRNYFRQWQVAERAVYIRSLLRAINVAEPTPWLPSIRTPVHVVHGEADRIIPVRVGPEIAAKLPNSKLTILPGIGHEPQHECLEQTCAFLEAALV